MRKPPTSATEEQVFDVPGLCRHFSELSPQPMVAVEGTTHIVRYLNDAFAQLVGKKPADLIGRPFAEAVPEREENGCLALLDRVYRTGTPEILAEQRHSEILPVYWSYSVWPMLGASESPVGVMVQVTDATEVATFRSQVVEINEQLLISGMRQQELVETADKASQVKDEFLATVSHELRTPLTVIVGWTDILKTFDLDPAVSLHAIEVIQRNARTQVQLIDDLLDVSRITSGKLRLNMQPVDLGTIISAAVEGMRPAAEAKEIQLQLELASSGRPLLGDPDRLQQVAWNLISNAIKFTPKGGRVSVLLANVESQAELTVSDTGQGIAPAFLPHVFERFRQADATTTRAIGGLGLGLAIVRQLVELHGGTVRVESEGEGLGATFTVSLALMARRDAVSGPKIVQQPQFKQQMLKGLHVLVVEDEVDACEVLQIILEGSGAQVKTARSVAAALKAMHEAVFDVLISDIGMPQEDGYSLIAKVRALGKEHGGQVPAAALTAHVGEEDRNRVLRAGFQIHVPKPVSPADLVAAISNLAGRTNS